MGRQLTETKVDFISLVKKGANGEQVTIYKSADSEADTKIENGAVGAGETGAVAQPATNAEADQIVKAEEQEEMKGFFQVLKDFFGGGKKDVAIAKSKDLPSPNYQSFSSRMNNQRGKVRDAIYVLEETMYSIFWDDDLEDGKSLILKNIDEFKEYVTKVLSEAIEVQKEAFAKTENEEEFELKKEDLMQVLKEALDPVTKSVTDLTAKVEKMEKAEETAPAAGTEAGAAASTEAPAAEVQKSEELTVDVVKSLLAETVAPITKSVEKLGERIQTVEQAKGVSKSLESTEVKKSEEDWAGVLSFIPGSTN